MKESLAIRIYRTLRTIQSNGILVGFKFAVVQFLGWNTSIRFRGFKHPVFIRGGTSDVSVAFEIFIKKGYKTPGKDFFEVIIDLGANVGYSAVFFAHHYPNAKIICLEPSEANFECLKKNTKFYNKIVLLNKGVWWRQTNLEVENPDSEPWGFRFKEVQNRGKQSICIDDLLKKYACNGKIMVKMDIEGAEKEIFMQCSDWIKETSCIQIEIHDCWKAVFDRLSDFNYHGQISGENVVIKLDRKYPEAA